MWNNYFPLFFFTNKKGQNQVSETSPTLTLIKIWFLHVDPFKKIQLANFHLKVENEAALRWRFLINLICVEIFEFLEGNNCLPKVIKHILYNVKHQWQSSHTFGMAPEPKLWRPRRTRRSLCMNDGFSHSRHEKQKSKVG